MEKHTKISNGKDEVISLFTEDSLQIAERANEIYQKNFDNQMKVIAVIEFSNYCEENCKFCENRIDNLSLERYRLNADEIIERVMQLSNSGVSSIILQSGQDTYYDTDLITYIIYSIKQYADVKLTLALSERRFDEYKRWKISGADCYMLNFETSNQNLYKSIQAPKNLDNRLRHIDYLKGIGFELISGIIIGLPEQNQEDIALDFNKITELGISQVYLSIFTPAPFTPFQSSTLPDTEFISKLISAARCYLNEKDILIKFDARTDCSPNPLKVTASGANVLVATFFNKNFETKITASKKDSGISENHSKVKSSIEKMGRKAAFH